MKKCEAIIQKAITEGRTALLLDEAMQICNLHHIPMPEFYLTLSKDEALEKAKKIGYPVALKIVSAQILHKSDSGGVVLNIRDDEELKVGYEKTMAIPKEKLAGILVEKMMPSAIELIIGGIRDSQFGPAVMFGIGGIFTEVYNDVAFRIAPIGKIDAMDLIQEIAGGKLLESIRGKTIDTSSIADALLNISHLMTEHEEINQIDLNPVLAYSDSLCAVDARIILEEKKEGR